jgi:hypothetical protein
MFKKGFIQLEKKNTLTLRSISNYLLNLKRSSEKAGELRSAEAYSLVWQKIGELQSSKSHILRPFSLR